MDTWQRRREAGWRLPAEGSIATVVVIAVLVVAVLVLLAVLVQDPPTSSASPRGDGAPAVLAGRVTHVVDGDTIDLADGTRIRLAIVDTPEVHGGLEPCGREASAFTRNLVLGEQVTIWRPTSAPATDRYGRLLGEVVRPDGRSLNVALVAAGLGTVDDRFVAEDPDLAARARAAQADAPSPACASVSAPSQDQETSDPPAPAISIAPVAPVGAGHTGRTDGREACRLAHRECLPDSAGDLRAPAVDRGRGPHVGTDNGPEIPPEPRDSPTPAPGHGHDGRAGHGERRRSRLEVSRGPWGVLPCRVLLVRLV